MIRQTRQPFWALIMTKAGVGKVPVGKVLALVADEYRVQLAQHIAKINGLDGGLIPMMPRMAVDMKEVSAEKFDDLRVKTIQLLPKTRTKKRGSS
jgi:hypothetical protein